MADSRIPVSCATCGKTVLRYPSHMRGEHQYCSRTCASPDCKISVSCDTCGVSMLRSPSHVKQRNYCSRTCSGVGASATFDTRDPIIYRPISCGRCGTVFWPLNSRNKHCSWQCRFLSIQDRFEDWEGCWEWPLSRLKITGYGQFNAGNNDTRTAHRIAWELNYGPIPEGLFVLHKCDNRACFRHHHLFLGTQQDNIDDMMAKGRNNHDPIHYRRLEDHPNAKLTVKAVHHIRSCNLSLPELAYLYDVCEGTIDHVLRGRTWKSC